MTDLIPYSSFGNLIRDPIAERNLNPEGTIRERPAERFTATLTLGKSKRAAGAIYVTWYDQEGRLYPMSFSDLMLVLRTCDVIKQTVTAEWIPVKRHRNFGLALYVEPGSWRAKYADAEEN